MKNKIFRGLLSLSIVAVLLTTILMAAIMYHSYMGIVQQDLRLQAGYIKAALSLGEKSYLQALKAETGKNARVTLIAPDGEVLFDNFVDTEQMTNHYDREEVKAAFVYGVGTSERFSDTLAKKTLYYAIKTDNGNVLRVSSTTNSVYSMVSSNVPYILSVILMVALLALWLAHQITNKLILPLDKVNLDAPLDNETYDELAPFLSRIDQQKKQLDKGLQKLQQKRDELATITQNMNEGLILLNDRNIVLSINDSAGKVFGLKNEEAIGNNILALDRGKEIQELLRKVSEDGHGENIYQKDGRCYQLCASQVGIKGSVLLVLDITEKMAAEQLRKEFSANVSHELKTPLQSILGYTEIMKNGLVQEHDKQRFLEKIYDEAHHLIGLIENIMELSRLDEQQGILELEDVNLYKLTQESIARLKQQALAKNLQIKVVGSDTNVKGSSSILGEVLYNLIDNAIKYNQDEGQIVITVATEADNVILTIADTGCGISVADQEHVFERFYRVDKSHFKETGGTGLGLAIVKHSVLLHHGKVELQSKLGVGTTIKIMLPQS